MGIYTMLRGFICSVCLVCGLCEHRLALMVTVASHSYSSCADALGKYCCSVQEHHECILICLKVLEGTL